MCHRQDQEIGTLQRSPMIKSGQLQNRIKSKSDKIKSKPLNGKSMWIFSPKRAGQQVAQSLFEGSFRLCIAWEPVVPVSNFHFFECWLFVGLLNSKKNHFLINAVKKVKA